MTRVKWPVHRGFEPEYDRTPSWEDRAACRTVDLEKILFFPKEDDARNWTPDDALAVCDRCEVVAECRGKGVRVEGGGEAKVWGVWGGETREQRIARRRKERRARR